MHGWFGNNWGWGGRNMCNCSHPSTPLASGGHQQSATHQGMTSVPNQDTGPANLDRPVGLCLPPCNWQYNNKSKCIRTAKQEGRMADTNSPLFIMYPVASFANGRQLAIWEVIAQSQGTGWKQSEGSGTVNWNYYRKIPTKRRSIFLGQQTWMPSTKTAL